MAGQAEQAERAAATAKKRRRPPLSCEQCRKRKIKCDRGLPCNHCSKSPAAETCTYAPAHIPKARRKPAPPAPPSAPAPGIRTAPVPLRPADGGTTTTHFSIRPTARATQIHTPDSEEFHRASVWQPLRPSSASRSVSHAGGPSSAASQGQDGEAEVRHPQRGASGTTFSSGAEGPQSEIVPHGRHRSEYTPPPKGSISKGRYFGQSHWMNIAASVRFVPSPF